MESTQEEVSSSRAELCKGEWPPSAKVAGATEGVAAAAVAVIAVAVDEEPPSYSSWSVVPWRLWNKNPDMRLKSLDCCCCSWFGEVEGSRAGMFRPEYWIMV